MLNGKFPLLLRACGEAMQKKTNYTYIGGQAVIQGVMMRGKRGMATVVRNDKGELCMEAKRITPPE